MRTLRGLFRGSLVSQNVFIETEKLTKMQSFPTQLVRFLFFTEVNGIPVSLVCSQQVSVVVKKYNTRHHYETHHAERYRGLQGQPRREKVKELTAGL